jgi:putative nucleotidyltransferase with HDIG domain
MRNSGSPHNCECGTRNNQINFDAGLDQTAAPADLSSTTSQRAQPAETIRESGDLRAQIIGSIKDLPPMPQVVIKIQQLISDLNSDNRQVAGIIESDQAIAAKVLKMANSAFYGKSGKVSSIHQASLLLGFRTLGEIVSVAGAADILSGSMPGYGYNSEELWKHSLAVAFTAKMIMNTKDQTMLHEAHTAGLIHDVGKIILDRCIMEHKDRFIEYMDQAEKTFLDAETYFFGFDHADIAYEICRTWKIPETISMAIKNHHHPSKSDGDLLSHVLHLADHLAMMGGIGYDEDDVLSEIDSGTIDFIGLKQQDLSDMTLKVLEAIDEL